MNYHDSQENDSTMQYRDVLPHQREYRPLFWNVTLFPLFLVAVIALLLFRASAFDFSVFLKTHGFPLLMTLLAVAFVSRRATLLVTRLSRSQEILEAKDKTLLRAQISLTRFAQLIENSDEYVSMMDADGRIFYLNPAGRTLLGLASEVELATLKLEDFYPEETLQCLREEALPAIEQTGHWDGEWRLRHPEKPEGLEVAASVFAVKHPETGEKLCTAIVQRDISFQAWLDTQLQQNIMQIQEQNVELEVQKMELQEANTLLAALASTDGLTGLKNHRSFQERLAEEFMRSARYGAELSVIFLDVDRFKQFNDTFGHPAGDTVLKRVAESLTQTARGSDVVTRYGGEEFAIILPETDAENAKLAAERLRVAIESEPWTQRQVTASLGIATYHVNVPDPATLITEADEALYRAKQNGRNCVAHFDDFVAQGQIPEARCDELIKAIMKRREDALTPSEELIKSALTHGYDGAIEGIAKLIDLREYGVDGHSERVMEDTVRLARAAGMTEEEVMFARWGALLHDLGKLTISDSVLQKPAALTDEEKALVRTHPLRASEMLAPIPFLRPALDIPLHHHEKWDGTGYPNGLKGEAIPKVVRIFRVVDLYDGLRSSRAYRAAWGENRALDFLRSESGRSLDPDAVKLFLDLKRQEKKAA